MKIKCDCGKIIEANVGDNVIQNKLRWYQSYHCKNCGTAVEIDGIDYIPTDVRTIIMEQDGRYELYLSNLKDRVKTIYLLKKIPHFEHLIFEAYIENGANNILIGTKGEVIIVKNYLEAKGISCLVGYDPNGMVKDLANKMGV